MNPLDAAKHNPLEGGASFSFGNRVYRAIWNVTWLLLASWTPPLAHGWRRMLLRAFGAKIARGANIYSSARIWDPRNLDMRPRSCLGPRVDCYSMARIKLGAHAIVSQDAVLCAGTHDVESPNFQLIARAISIGDHAWIAAGAFVGPGVGVGEGAVLGARAVAFKDLRPWTVYVGNPALQIRERRRSQADKQRM